MRLIATSTQETLRLRVVRVVQAGMSQAEAARVFEVSRHLGQRLGTAAARGRLAGGAVAAAGSTTHLGTEAVPCGDHGSADYRPVPRPAQVAVCVVDPRGGPGHNRSPIRRPSFGLDGGARLRRWGFTPQKPLRRAYEQNPAAVRRGLKKQYPAIRVLAQRERATIFGGDETEMRSDHQAGGSWGRRGQTPVSSGTGQRFRCNMLLEITNRGKPVFMVFKGRFTAAVCATFLHRLIRHAQEKVFVIVGAHPVHKAGDVAAWVVRHRRQIRLFFLPGYSPELKPNEYLNHDVKTNAVERTHPRHPGELLANVQRFMWSAQWRLEKVGRYCRHPHVRYAAPRTVKQFCSP